MPGMRRLALFFILCTVFASAQVHYESLIRSQEASCCDGCPITCPPRWTSGWNYEHGELTSQSNNEAYACRVPSSTTGGGICKTVMPGNGPNTNWDTIWARQGRCKLRCPPKPWIAGTGYTIGNQVYSQGHGYECIVSGTSCGSPPYEPGVGPLWWRAWKDTYGDCQQQLCRGEVWKIGTPYALGEVVQRTVSGIVQLYQCINAACSSASSAYAPGTGANTALAWTEVGACREPCDGCKLCLPTCPVNRWIRRPAGTNQPVYTGVSVVYNPLTGDHYLCYKSPNCDQAGYEPGVGSNWPLAWVNLGKCHHRCPLVRWALQTNYVPNTRVYHQGRAYRCLNGHTSSTSTEPGAGSFWTAYWRDEGLCHRPTCPRLEWNPQTSYVNGDQVVGQAGASDTRYYCMEASRCRGDANSPPNGAWLDYGPCKKPCCKEACLPTCPVRIWVAGAAVSSGTQVVHKGVQYQCAPPQGQTTCSVEPGAQPSWRTEWRWIGPCQHRCPLDVAGVAILWRSGGSYPASSNRVYQPANGHMYACTQPSLCGSPPYEPGVGPLWAAAWIDLGECQLKHCPRRQFVRSQQYALGEEVLVPTNDVYICINPSLCSSTNSAYWPPTGASWSTAWKYHGKCKPKCDCEKDCLWTCATTSAWQRSAAYVAGSIVYNDVTGHTYRCYDPANCPLPNYSPGVPPGTSWPLAWYDEGPCRLNCGSPWSSAATYTQNQVVYNHATGHNYICYATNGCPAGYQYQPGVGPLSWPIWKDLGPCSLRRCPNAHWVQGYAYAVAEKIERDGYEWQCIDAAQCGSCPPTCAAWRLVGPCAGSCNPDRLQERKAGMDSSDYYDKEDKAYANSRRLKERMDSGRFHAQADFTVLAFGEAAAGDGGDKGDKNFQSMAEGTDKGDKNFQSMAEGTDKGDKNFRSMAEGTDKDDKGLAARNDDGPDAVVADFEAAAAGDKDDKGFQAAARGDDGGDRASARQRSADTSESRAAEHAEVVADARHRSSALGDALQSAGLAAVGAVVTLAVQGVYLLFRRHDSPRASVLEMQPVNC